MSEQLVNVWVVADADNEQMVPSICNGGSNLTPSMAFIKTIEWEKIHSNLRYAIHLVGEKP